VNIPQLDEEETKCEILFSNQEELKLHVKTIRKTYKCIYCTESKVFATISGLRKHTNAHHQSEIIKCKFDSRCAIYFRTEEEKEQHILNFHQQGKNAKKCVYCNCCITIKSLSRHVKEFHSKEAIKCNFHQYCPTYFLTVEEREKHILENHKTESKTKMCIYCKKVVVHLPGHIRSRHKSQAIKCNFNGLCATYFLSYEEKQKHIALVHRNNCIKCIYCEKMLKKSQSEHMNRHHKDVAIKCNFHFHCPTYFYTEEERDEHVLKVHQTAKPAKEVKCIYCEKKFLFGGNLSQHISLKHSDVKIKCQLFHCSQYFLNQEEKEKHFQETHAEGEKLKKYKCDLCTFKSSFKSSLKLHIQVNHFAEILKCSLCAKKFKSKVHLVKHFANMHTDRLLKTCIHCKQKVKNITNFHLLSKVCKICNKSIPCRGINEQHKKFCNDN